MTHLTLVSALIAIIAVAFLITGIKRLAQRRVASAAGLELSALVFMLIAVACFLLASNLYTYERLVYEQPVAEVSFEQLDEQQYRVKIRSLDSAFQRDVVLQGDEWQLDAQVLTWQGLATLFGLDANYRLHRIAGRYSDIDDEQQRARSVFSLVRKQHPVDDERIDLWQFARRHHNWLHWVDAAYGSAVFLPMTDGAKYAVSISRTGLIARPANKVAKKAVSQWIGL